MADAMRIMRRIRTDASTGESLGNHLGKHLGNPQVVPSVMSSMIGNVSNLPMVKKANAMLSSTGGLQGHIHHTHNAHTNKRTHQVSPHDARRLVDTMGGTHGIVKSSKTAYGSR